MWAIISRVCASNSCLRPAPSALDKLNGRPMWTVIRGRLSIHRHPSIVEVPLTATGRIGTSDLDAIIAAPRNPSGRCPPLVVLAPSGNMISALRSARTSEARLNAVLSKLPLRTGNAPKIETNRPPSHDRKSSSFAMNAHGRPTAGRDNYGVHEVHVISGHEEAALFGHVLLAADSDSGKQQEEEEHREPPNIIDPVRHRQTTS